MATVTNPGSFMATITHPTGNGYCRDRILRDTRERVKWRVEISIYVTTLDTMGNSDTNF